MKTRIDLIRHGETEWNLQSRFQGQQDSPLSTRGRRQAEALRVYYDSIDFQFIYSSDLGRAVDTANTIIAKDSKVELKQREELRERKFGVFEGLTQSEAEATHPEDYRTWTAGAFDFKAKGGESRRELLDRSKKCFEEIAELHRGDYGLLVVHGGLLSTFWRYLEPGRGEDEGFKIPNASITELVYEDGEWEVLCWSKVEHLHDLDALDDVTAR